MAERKTTKKAVSKTTRGRSTRSNARTNRPNRVPVSGRRDILTVVGKDESFHYHWVKEDDKAQIERFLAGGYDFVTSNDLEIGEDSIDQGTVADSRIQLSSGKETLYLMRIPMEWYEEDHAKHKAKVDEREAGLKRSLNSGENGTYGKTDFEVDVRS